MHNRKSDGKNSPNYFSFSWMMVIALCITICLNWPTMNSRFWNTFSQTWYHIACANTFAAVFLMITFTNIFTIYLDSKWLWEENLWKRLFFQILLGLMAPILICYFFGWASFYFLKVNISSTRYIRNMSSLLVLICIMINLLHIVLYYIHKVPGWIKNEARNSKTDLVEHLYIPDGKGEKKIATETIAYIFIDTKTTYIQHHNGDRNVCFLALDNLYEKLDHALFFRANRTYIVSRLAVEGYEKINDRSLSVKVLPKTKENISVSRLKATQFIQWFRASF